MGKKEEARRDVTLGYYAIHNKLSTHGDFN